MERVGWNAENLTLTPFAAAGATGPARPPGSAGVCPRAQGGALGPSRAGSPRSQEAIHLEGSGPQPELGAQTGERRRRRWAAPIRSALALSCAALRSAWERRLVEKIRLGLIGDNIAASRAPAACTRLRVACGASRSPTICWSRPSWASGSTRCSSGARRGTTTGSTSPTPTRSGRRHGSRPRAPSSARSARSIRWCSGAGGPRGFNTDHTGFIAAWRARFSPARPGVVCQVGAGGVGRAVAFGLAELGATSVRLVDLDRPRSKRLAANLREARPDMEVRAVESLDQAAKRRARHRQLLADWHGRPRRNAGPARTHARRGVGLRRGLHPRSTPASLPMRRRPASTP